ncbi:hypothetical protein SODALDRAFT_218045 [Sodiomyces alkalinus F11]|uniref:Uncharacterized protein n=1 Tax=Sodiomyces alkalinus (strain CBS 110278 / VKM F-3762 / F11) TaxID=1314773 RepID=A0A3N2PPC5_SODAK|nr:hypothetical protein SODALDRAFT_218045 [Sodiomyces alkalinus F11]ROT36367.1 hypothetical protein SODALDRAFT_218045 [Sodiomyces alkalinus F11]
MTACGAGEVHLPLEFKYIMREVDSLDGAGMPLDHKLGRTVQFWEGLNESTSVDGASDLVRPGDAIRDLAGLPRDWQVRVGWKSGAGPRSNTSCWIIYCARIGEPAGRDALGRRRNKDHKAWAWRYMVVDEKEHSHVMFNDVCQLLEWCMKDIGLPYPDLPSIGSIPAPKPQVGTGRESRKAPVAVWMSGACLGEPSSKPVLPKLQAQWSGPDELHGNQLPEKAQGKQSEHDPLTDLMLMCNGDMPMPSNSE